MEVGVTTLHAADAEAHPAPSAALRIQLLGPLRLWRGAAELDTGPRQQAYLLALLLAHDGLPIGRSELVDMMWGDRAPHSAVNVIHKYVGALRRLLEPALPTRGASSYLVRRGDGYLCTAGAGTLDLATFRQHVGSARSARGQGRHQEALDLYEQGLRLWQGPAGDGLAYEPEAMPVFAGLNGEFLDACTEAAELAVSCGRPELILPRLRLAASIGPLHEPVQASLITALGAAGRQAEALSVFRTVRTRLGEELGIDPGPVLELAHQRVLRQDLNPAAVRQIGAATVGTLRTSSESAPRTSSAGGALLGRSAERAVLRAGLERAASGASGVVVVEGEPGVGKTRLLEETASEARERGGLAAWGSCTDGEGAPSMWPWVQVVRTVLDGADVQERERWHATGLGAILAPRDDVLTGQVVSGGSGQFRLFENVVSLIASVSVRRPVMIVIDDLQWADVASLQLFGHLASRLPPGTVLIGALRDRGPVPGTQLGQMLAGLSRSSGHRRLRLGPLGLRDVAELVQREIGQRPGTTTIRTIHSRTAGNPFFVQELARLVGSAGPLVRDSEARAGIPSTVRDVVRDRMAVLDDDTKDLLEIAALIGRDVNLNLLAQVADLDVSTCLTRLERVEALGFVTPTPGDTYSVRFVHDLVRESVSDTTASRRATRLHLRVADVLEQMAPHGESAPERVAHHLWAAGPLAEPARTAAALVRSGRRAAAKSALEVAEPQLRLAAQVARTAGLAEAELAALSELTAVIGMRSMYAGAELELLERAEHLARGLGMEAEAAGILYSRWAAHLPGIDLERSGTLAKQLLEQGESSPHPIVRTYGLQAWGTHQYHVGNIGEGFRYLSTARQSLFADDTGHQEHPVRNGLHMLLTGMLAETTALHGDVDGAHALLDLLGVPGDRYSVTVWATWSSRIAAMVGDPTWALRAAEKGIALDPEFSYGFLGTYQRLATYWARAVTGDDPAGAAQEAERLIESNLVNPVRSCISTWYALLGDMLLAAGELRRAAAALDQADHHLNAHGQRYSEGLILLLRARLLREQGHPIAAVRAVAQKARSLATERGAHLFVQRAEVFLSRLAAEPSGC